MLPTRGGLEREMGARSAVWLWWIGAAVAFSYGLYELRAWDAFFHLASGREALLRGETPLVDPFSHSFPGRHWANHSWAFQKALFLLYRVGGVPALAVFQGLAGLAIYATATRGPRNSDRFASILILVALAAFREQLVPRPQVIGMICCALALRTAAGAQEPRHAHRIWQIVPIYCLWVITHGSHLLLFSILLIGGVGSWAQGSPGRGHAHFHWWGSAAVCAALLTTVAPQSVFQGVEHLDSRVLRSVVAEWQPVSLGLLVDTSSGRVSLILVALTVLGLLPGMARARTRKRSDLAWLLQLAAFSLLALSSTRMLALWLFGAAPLWIEHAVRPLQQAQRWLVTHVSARVPALFVGGGFVLLGSVPLLQFEGFPPGIGIDRGVVPVAAVDHLERKTKIRRIYNAYNYGGYLMFRGHRVLVDGRAITLYPETFLQDFVAAYDDPVLFERLSSHYECDGALLPVGSWRTVRLRRYLDRHPEWVQSYADTVAVLYERVDTEAQPSPR